MASQALPQGINPNYVVLVGGVYYDLCVMCKDDTGVPTSCPIAERQHYIEGCGQLCKDCYDNADFMT